MSEIKPEVVDRMVALVRKMGGSSSIGRPYQDGETIQFSSSHYETARAIVAALPMPIDPDMIEARRMESAQAEANGFIDYAVSVRNGDQDNEGPVRCRYEGIKRGRELATPTSETDQLGGVGV